MTEPAIIFQSGVAYVPFNVEQLIWLIDQYSLRDEYREVLWQAVKKLEAEQSATKGD